MATLRSTLAAFSTVLLSGGNVLAGGADVSFSGSVSNACTVNTEAIGTFGTTVGALGAGMNMPGSSTGSVRANCLTSGSISVSGFAPSSNDAINLANTSGYTWVAKICAAGDTACGNPGVASNDGNNNNRPGTVYSHGADMTFPVGMQVSTGSDIPTGSYTYIVHVTLAPN